MKVALPPAAPILHALKFSLQISHKFKILSKNTCSSAFKHSKYSEKFRPIQFLGPQVENQGHMTLQAETSSKMQFSLNIVHSLILINFKLFIAQNYI